MFNLGKYQFILLEECSEPYGGYLQYQICKENSGPDDIVYEINVFIHSETYSVEPFFLYYGNSFGDFNSVEVDWDKDIWYYGEDMEGWKFAIPKASSINNCALDLSLCHSKALTIVKLACTIRDNYDEFISKMNKEVVELQL